MPDRGRRLWLVEEGIGEDRAIRLDGGRIVAAMVEWPGALRAGLIAEALLVSRAAGSARGVARFADGQQALVDHLPPDASEGSRLRLEVIRSAISEERRTKWARARPTGLPPAPAPSLEQRLRDGGDEVRIVRRFPPCDWDELVSEAFDQHIAFGSGSLHFSPTPAMTLIDIDAADRPDRVALAAIGPLADALRRFALGGAIAIDFPTIPDKARRQEADRMLGLALEGWPHERTAMNGFGLVQIVARLERPTLLHLAAHHGPQWAARLLLRRAEALSGPGRLSLSAHPAVIGLITPTWLEELARRTGRDHVLQANPALAPQAPQAQLIVR